MRNIAVEIAHILIEIGAVNFAPDAPKTFKSGIISPVYVDNRTIPFYPDKWRQVIDGFRETIASQNIDFDVVAGIAVGGVPHSAALGYAMGKPSVFVRKEAKEYGLQNRVEGGDVTGRRVLLVEDLVTTGGSSLSGISALRESGAIIEHCIVIVRYDFPEATQNFADGHIALHTLTTFPVIVEQAVNQGKFTDNELAVINDWLHDPRGWAGRHGFT